MEQAREFSEGVFTYTLWFDWSSGKCRIAKIGCISGHSGGSLSAKAGYGEKVATHLGWESVEFETAEDAEEFVRRQHLISCV